MNQQQSDLVNAANKKMEDINRCRQLLRKLTLLRRGRVIRIAEVEEELRDLLGD